LQATATELHYTPTPLHPNFHAARSSKSQLFMGSCHYCSPSRGTPHTGQPPVSSKRPPWLQSGGIHARPAAVISLACCHAAEQKKLRWHCVYNSVTTRKTKKEPKLRKKPKPALVHHQPCRPAGRLPTPSPFPFRCRHQSNSQPKPLFASTENLLPRNASPSHHATTCHRSSGQIYWTIPASRPHVRSIPSTSAHPFFNPREIDPTIPLHFFISPPRGSCLCRRSLPYHHLTCSCPRWLHRSRQSEWKLQPLL
jgi:hypothetical protein